MGVGAGGSADGRRGPPGAAGGRRKPPKTAEGPPRAAEVEGVAEGMLAFLASAPAEAWDSGKLRKEREHNHWTGAYRGAACHSCNMKLKDPNTILVLFHNGEGFDFHELIRGQMKLAADGRKEEEAAAAPAKGSKRRHPEEEESEMCTLVSMPLLFM